MIYTNFAFNFRTLINILAVMAILLVLLFEDTFNGKIAEKRMLAGTSKATSSFKEDGFSSTTQVGTTTWHYDTILMLAETTDYFVFIFSNNHAQIYDKGSLQGGDIDQFRSFLEKKTNQKIQYIK